MDKWDTSKNEKKIGKWGASVENDKWTERIKECKTGVKGVRNGLRGAQNGTRGTKNGKYAMRGAKNGLMNGLTGAMNRLRTRIKWAFREFALPFWYLKASLMVHCLFTYSNADTGWTVDNDVKSCSGLYRIRLA